MRSKTIHGAAPAALPGLILALGTWGAPLLGQKLPAVSLKEVVDDRYGGGTETGALILVLKLEGENLEAFPEGRARPVGARDAAGRSLLPAKSVERPFTELRFNPGIQLWLATPPRESTSIDVSGVVELFCPAKDPGAVVRIQKALAKLDAPLDAPGLKAAGIQLTPLSKGRYADEMKKQEGPEATARLRNEMKKEGATDEEIEALLELRKAFAGLDDPADRLESVALLARSEEMQRIRSVSFLAADGSEIASRGMSSDSDGVTATRRYKFAKAPGPDATLVLTLLTDGSRVSVPFELKKVPLP